MANDHDVQVTILSTDRCWEPEDLVEDHGPCSRCGAPIPEEDVPLLVWAQDGRMWGFHFLCVGIDPHDVEEDDDQEGDC